MADNENELNCKKPRGSQGQDFTEIEKSEFVEPVPEQDVFINPAPDVDSISLNDYVQSILATSLEDLEQVDGNCEVTYNTCSGCQWFLPPNFECDSAEVDCEFTGGIVGGGGGLNCQESLAQYCKQGIRVDLDPEDEIEPWIPPLIPPDELLWVRRKKKRPHPYVYLMIFYPRDILNTDVPGELADYYRPQDSQNQTCEVPEGEDASNLWEVDKFIEAAPFLFEFSWDGRLLRVSSNDLPPVSAQDFPFNTDEKNPELSPLFGCGKFFKGQCGWFDIGDSEKFMPLLVENPDEFAVQADIPFISFKTYEFRVRMGLIRRVIVKFNPGQLFVTLMRMPKDHQQMIDLCPDSQPPAPDGGGGSGGGGSGGIM